MFPRMLCFLPTMSDEFSGRDLLWETIQQREDYPIFRLTYLSTPVEWFTDEDLDQIEEKSLANNDARDVTGILIVNGRRILQVLEGRREAVLDLFEKIKHDPRHVITKLVSTAEDEERMLLTWNMVVRDVTDIPEDVLKEYVAFYEECLHATEPREITIDDIDLLKSVSLFSALPV